MNLRAGNQNLILGPMKMLPIRRSSKLMNVNILFVLKMLGAIQFTSMVNMK